MSTWYTADTPEEASRLLAAWSDAPVENEELCSFLFDVAREQVLSFAPALPEGAEIPARLIYAQLMQAQNLWNAGRAQQDGNVGTEGYSYTPRPLDKTVRSIIRPTSGVPRVL